MSKIIRLIDRTRTVADWKCPRARYWGYEYGGRGITRAGSNLELFLGITLHDALAAIARLTLDGQEVGIDEIAEAAFKQVYAELAPEGTVEYDAVEFAKEQGTLVEGIVRGFYKHVWPILMNQYEIVCTEEEMEYPLDPDGQFVFMTKPDLILEDKVSGELVYIEYKSTSSKKDNWVSSWETAVQLHSSVKATERSLGRSVEGVRIVGMYKGYESYGKQSSPFCYAYKKAGNPPFTKDQIEYSFKSGFRRTATWEMPGGVKAWVEQMPTDILASQFPMTPIIYVNDELIEAFFRQRLEREKEILLGTCASTTEADMDRIFPQRFDQCNPGYGGYKCGFMKLCHGYVADPLAEGFVWREPHHDQERDQLGLEPKGEE